MDVKSLFAAQQYSALKSATAATNLQNPMKAFSEVTESYASTLRNAEVQAMANMTGDADPHALVEALSQSQIAVETAVTVRNRVVEAYQEILRMPI